MTPSLDIDALRTRWTPLGSCLPDACLLDLAARYAEPWRVYHGLAHIDALARLFADVERGPSWRVPVEVELAILYHDAIYEPGQPDNEARSAELARVDLRDAGLDVDSERVVAMILATKTHAHLDDPSDHDLAHFLDADMAILGVSAPSYATYTQSLRREYASVPEPSFRRGRRAFVEAQLGRATVFHTPFFRARYEAQARQNLARELGELG